MCVSLERKGRKKRWCLLKVVFMIICATFIPFNAYLLGSSHTFLYHYLSFEFFKARFSVYKFVFLPRCLSHLLLLFLLASALCLKAPSLISVCWLTICYWGWVGVEANFSSFLFLHSNDWLSFSLSRQHKWIDGPWIDWNYFTYLN